MKKISIFPLIALVVLAGCTPASSDIDGSSSSSETMMQSSSEDAMMKNSSADEMDSSSSEEMDSSDAEADANIVAMNATNWEFSPSAVVVKQGEKTILRITNTEGAHSFQSNDLGINIPLAAGETKDIEIPTDKAGTFSFRCGVPCGAGHKDMVGTIVVG